ncbi:isochorismatase family protein [Actinoplanes sandaracinus]
MQNALVSAPTAPYSDTEVAARAVELTRAFREHRAPVVLTRVTARADGSDAAPGRTDALNQPGSLPEDWDAIVDDLAGHPEDITVTKRTWSTFRGTDLDLRLRRRGVRQIVLAGLTTSIGV